MVISRLRAGAQAVGKACKAPAQHHEQLISKSRPIEEHAMVVRREMKQTRKVRHDRHEFSRE